MIRLSPVSSKKRSANHAVPLPEPLEVLRFHHVQFEVYLAKDFFSKKWCSPVLRDLVRQARRAYLRYGDVPLLDSYDAKSAIYLVRASYKKIAKDHSAVYPVEEWTSLRFIPAAGLPALTEDLEACRYRNKSIGYWMQKKFFKGQDARDQIITISRFCGIPPCIRSKNGTLFFNKKVSSKQEFSGISFAFIIDHFLQKKEGIRCRYITSLLQDSLIKKIFKDIRVGRKKYAIKFTPAYKMFGLRNVNAISFDRQLLSYKFPTYFLNTSQILTVLQSLLDREILTVKTIKRYLGTNLTPLEILHNHAIYHLIMDGPLQKLGKLLSIRGPVYGSTLTGEKLRAILDVRVEDFTKLYIMDTKLWKKRVNGFVKKLIIVNNPLTLPVSYDARTTYTFKSEATTVQR